MPAAASWCISASGQNISCNGIWHEDEVVMPLQHKGRPCCKLNPMGKAQGNSDSIDEMLTGERMVKPRNRD